MKYIPIAVSTKVARAILVGQKHSPTILFGAGILGFGATVVLASKATLRLDETLTSSAMDKEAARVQRRMRSLDEYSEMDYKKDTALLYFRGAQGVARLYLPSFIVGSLSVACLTGSHKILSNRNAGLTAAYAAVDKAFKEYRARVIRDAGEEKDREYRYGSKEVTIVEETKNGPKEKVVKRLDSPVGSPYAKCFDETNHCWQNSAEMNRYFLEMKQAYLNNRLHARGHIFLNEVYRELGFPDTKKGQVVGWVVGSGGDDFIDFGLYTSERQKVRDFMNGHEGSVWLDFNVDGNILDLIEKKKGK